MTHVPAPSASGWRGAAPRSPMVIITSLSGTPRSATVRCKGPARVADPGGSAPEELELDPNRLGDGARGAEEHHATRLEPDQLRGRGSRDRVCRNEEDRRALGPGPRRAGEGSRRVERGGHVDDRDTRREGCRAGCGRRGVPVATG